MAGEARKDEGCGSSAAAADMHRPSSPGKPGGEPPVAFWRWSFALCSVCSCVRVPVCVCACVRVCVCVCARARALGIVSTDKIVRFINTLTIISYGLCLMILSEWGLPVP